jgi:hypothetical protein
MTLPAIDGLIRLVLTTDLNLTTPTALDWTHFN